MEIKKYIAQCNRERKKGYFILLDPEKTSPDYNAIVQYANDCRVDGIMIGGSRQRIEKHGQFVKRIKQSTDVPIIAFPGSHYQLCDSFDAVFLLTLLNSRNPKYLIEEHYEAAAYLYDSHIDTINTAYLIISDSHDTSVIRETKSSPIPFGDIDTVIQYCKLIALMNYDIAYIEAGSGAQNSVCPSIMSTVRSIINIPIIAGGGIRDASTAEGLLKNGADFIVTGNIVEENPSIIREFTQLIEHMNNG